MRTLSPACLLLLFLAACDTVRPAASPEREPDLGASASSFDARRELLARQLARTLNDSAFRSSLDSALRTSTHPEGKVAIDHLLIADRGRLAAAIRAATGRDVDLDVARQLELYFPVDRHRSSWRGESDLLVGTIGRDTETPVAFTLSGRRLALDAEQPPETPVLAVVPRETDFADAGTTGSYCPECEGDAPGLYVTRVHTRSTFESWLKGKPEFEILVLGQAGNSDSLTVHACLNERGTSPAYYNQDGKDWSGSALVMSQADLDHYRALHPGQALRLFMVEDDDTPCVIKSSPADIAALLASVDTLVQGLAGGRDILSTAGRLWKAVPVLQQVISTAASLIRTDDDLVGNAVEDVTTSERYAGYNWIVKGDHAQTNGTIAVEMRGDAPAAALRSSLR